MSEQQVREQKFTYSSNLVIQREHAPRVDEPTGEPESLVGRINPREMGTMAQRANVQRKKDVSVHFQREAEVVGIENLIYRPKTKDNRLVYEKLLSIVYNLMQEQSQEVIKSVVDEILAIMKNEEETEKRGEVEALIGKTSNELFSDIVLNCKAITDYTPELEEGRQEEIQVPLNLEEEGESSEAEEIVEESSESESEHTYAIRTKEKEKQGRQKLLNIDGYWLQRELNKIYNDPIVSQEMEPSVLQMLNASTDIECENQLVQTFGQEKFELIQLLHRHRVEIYFCTLLGKAEGEQVEQIHQMMRQSREGSELLVELSRKSGKQNKEMEMEEELQMQTLNDQEFQSLNMKQIDLEQLQFHSQGHHMSNEKCHLPPHSFKVTKKGYEEIYIPAPKGHVHTDPLININELPVFARDAFKGFKELNVIQSAVYDKALLNNENMLICAPTGAGKTNIALLTMLQVIGEYYQNGQVDTSKFKIIYIAPMKALVNEMVHNFQTRLEPYNIRVAEVTGDTHLTKQQLNSTQILIATPEKWDILTRKTQSNEFISLVRLLIIDEIHLLHDSRGPVLEAIVARTIRSIEDKQQYVRIVGLSATLPNYADVASFIRAKKNGVFFFDNSFRPVPLQQQYIGITEKKPIRRMLLMNEILYDKISERAGKAQILVFVHSRKETVKTAKTLKEMAFAKDELGKFLKEESSSKKILEEVLIKEDIRSHDLKELLAAGFAIHHAGLSRGDRDLVESLFEKKHIQVLVSTSTLAWGVNLPAHTVIIKGTQIYSPEQGRWIELSPQDILQMMGRAGRPRYDTQGEGIILTTYQELKYYLSLLNMQLPIESQFIQSLADQMNAEIAIGTIKNVKEAINWLGYTYLYVRMMRNPLLYGSIDTSDQYLVKYRADLVHSAAIILEKNFLIKYDHKTATFESTILGKIASNFYIKYPSIAIYNQHLKQNMGMIDVLKVFSLSQEFKLIPIREEEKAELSKLMMSVPVPIKGTPDDPTTKVNVLLQSFISRLRLEGYALNSDLVYVTQSAGRIMRALYEICLKKEWAPSALQCLALSKMIEKRMWNCMTPLRQFKGLPEDMLRRIEKKEGITWDHLYNMSAQQLGELIRYQNQPITKMIHKYIHKFPKIEIQAFAQPITRSCLKIDLQLSCDFQWDEKIHGKQSGGAGLQEPFHIFVLDCDSEKILYHEQLMMKQKNQTMQFTLTVPLFEIMHPIYFIKVVSDKWLQCESEQPIPFKNLILPEAFSRCTELLQLTPLSLEILKQPQLENIISKKILMSKHFDQVQTQVFQQVYSSNENLFLGSPSYESKHIISHLAIMQLQRGFKAIYVSPLQENCDRKYQDFINLFTKPSSFKVAMLTGQIGHDQKLLEQNDIIVSNAINWDIMTRRWRARKGFRDIRIFVVDDLHMVGESGSVLEVIVSRMRMIQMDNQFRIVGLSLSVADYKEMGEWIGAKHVFNFSPTVRGNNVQIIISSFDQPQRSSRLESMIKSIKPNLAKDCLNLVFVSDRKLARIAALELMGQNNIESNGANDQYLSHTLSAGIAYLHECMDINDEKEVLRLIQANLISTVVLTYKLGLKYRLMGQVFVLDNQKYDGLEKRFVDYTIAEMLELVECGIKQCHLLTYTPKKEYYKKFLFEPMPIESHLNHYLANHLNAEIVAKNIHNTQDCIDWITWTFLYRRLTYNPNYYNLHEVTGMAINNYLSELIETTIEELHESKCIAVEEDNELEAINSGIIANYYYINIDTVKTFSDRINANSKLKDLLFIMAESQEFEVLNIRNGEEILLHQLAAKLPYTPPNAKLNEPNTKALILFQSYFQRLKLNPDLKSDYSILELAIRLTTAMVDVASSNLWLKPAILCMHLCQMIVQALWKDDDSPLLQLPHFTRETVQSLKQLKVEDLADFADMDEKERTDFLSRFTQTEVEAIAQALNRFPSVEIKAIHAEEEVIQGDIFQVQVILERQDDVYTEFVIAPHYPRAKEEQWWVLCADKRTHRLFGNKKVNFRDTAKVDLRFQAPEAGNYEMTVYAICDSYVGADTTSTFPLRVIPIIEQEQE